MGPDAALAHSSAIDAALIEVEKIRALAIEPTLLRHSVVLRNIADRLTVEIATFRGSESRQIPPTHAVSDSVCSPMYGSRRFGRHWPREVE